MRLLLDTHVWLWWLGDDRRLGRRARQALAQSEVRGLRQRGLSLGDRDQDGPREAPRAKGRPRGRDRRKWLPRAADHDPTCPRGRPPGPRARGSVRPNARGPGPESRIWPSSPPIPFSRATGCRFSKPEFGGRRRHRDGPSARRSCSPAGRRANRRVLRFVQTRLEGGAPPRSRGMLRGSTQGRT